ncbi:hypothetical protein P4G95_09040 [Burkholderia vietnamiensis]|uniref:hypothetical protein n=1 Tax=Burkholderia vietnamiensis TaxID=60552 RepID=UPI001593DB2B|nr:hypothetical protein [Burkholderia vietnamiensis]WHU91023.1 hypothetical protein P4G95_09040 [Burkholderia vietnamiensis]
MNCKPGDLAIIVASIFPEEIGVIVEVMRIGVPGVDFHPDANAPAWIVKSDRPLPRYFHETKKFYSWSNEKPIADARLRPVSGLPITDDVEDEVTA